MKGVFCIEGFWYGDHRDKTSVQPILELIHGHSAMPFIHHRCATVAEFTHSINRWKTKSFHNKYPILYLAFHGEAGLISIGKEKITLLRLSELLDTKCRGVIVYFGSCDTLNVHKSNLTNFLNNTGALAICGYKKEINWLKSASFEIQLFNILTSNPFDNKGIKKIEKQINEECSYFIKNLNFRIETNQTQSFPRKRKTKLLK